MPDSQLAADLRAAIADRGSKRDDVARIYAQAAVTTPSTGWNPINEAIMERWSYSGLKYIKRKAWKILAEAAQ